MARILAIHGEKKSAVKTRAGGTWKPADARRANESALPPTDARDTLANPGIGTRKGSADTMRAAGSGEER
ncbi:hypothetical protein OU994_10850 [Pseudoduganella sp. SL102]|uniref:hypothetical protein n=1 Tax=Pseudoduganella sp. SL102 TaxID=2995154 RepID=UPI00248BD411|nr:hypothetical protein [Pseudoduganella sp. SL102]WBS04733.1 hypothetical protein OU994_10850 [Pseudoduganella sp. SL102]